MAISTLWYTFNKTDHLSTLKCVAVHEAYPTKSRDMPVTLDVHCKEKWITSFDIHAQIFFKPKMHLKCRYPAYHQKIWKKTLTMFHFDVLRMQIHQRQSYGAESEAQT